MRHRYIPRALEPVLRKAAAQFPAVVLTGPRQSGKTTLLKHIFGAASGYISLEPPDVCAAAAADPRGFLEMHPAPVIFDEVQYAPDLLPYIKESIDERRNARGQYFLKGVAESPADRTSHGIVGRQSSHATAIARLTTRGVREVAQSTALGTAEDASCRPPHRAAGSLAVLSARRISGTCR